MAGWPSRTRSSRDPAEIDAEHECVVAVGTGEFDSSQFAAHSESRALETQFPLHPCPVGHEDCKISRWTHSFILERLYAGELIRGRSLFWQRTPLGAEDALVPPVTVDLFDYPIDAFPPKTAKYLVLSGFHEIQEVS